MFQKISPTVTLVLADVLLTFFICVYLLYILILEVYVYIGLTENRLLSKRMLDDVRIVALFTNTP